MLPVKHRLAVWQGPFGWERTAWRVIWLYSKAPQKQALAADAEQQAVSVQR
jgi:hypothetical protein